MKKWISLALILVPFSAAAASFWDGNAALQRGDASFEAHMLAVSDSFAPGTQVVIQNLDNGKTATVTITSSITGQSDILVLLSPPAASALGIGAGTVARVRITLASLLPGPTSAGEADQETSRDTDINPAAGYTAGQEGAHGLPLVESLPPAQAPAAQVAAAPTTAPEAPPAEQAAATTGPSTTAQAAQSTGTETTAATGTGAQTAASTSPAGTGTPSGQGTAAAQAPVTAPAPSAEEARASQDAAILANAAARQPQKQLYLPPREDSTFAYHPPAPPAPTTPAVTPTQAAVETPPPATKEPQITEAIGEPGVAPAAAAEQPPALAEATAPPAAGVTEVVGEQPVKPAAGLGSEAVALAEPNPAQETAGTTAPPPEPVQTEVTGPVVAPPPGAPPSAVALAAPEAPAPVTAAVQATATTPTTQQTGFRTEGGGAAATTAPAQTTAASRPTSQETWYVQLAAYATEKGARDIAATLAPTYPAVVIAPAGTGPRIYRVLVGPLNRAESGTLLVWFRFRGFPDAFVKQE